MKHNFSKILTDWYELNKRDLPWRHTQDPYLIWISEIILQQTRVVQGLSYYHRFIEQFPTVIHLAEAHEDDVLKCWQGLGYYSRARNIHKASHQIMSVFGGVFPNHHKDILTLAGIGDYTSAAISSFAFNLPYAVVDGNVYRVLSRIFGIETAIDSPKGKKEFSVMAQELLSQLQPGLHNQAIMEFGALQCVPVSPNCSICPFQESCCALKLNMISNLPVKSKKTMVSHRFFNYLFINYQSQTFIQKRIEKDVWQNLYEFPLIETDHLLSASELLENDQFCKLFNGIDELIISKISKPMKHILTHRVIFAQFISIEISALNLSIANLERLDLNQINNYAVSRLMELFIEKLVID